MGISGDIVLLSFVLVFGCLNYLALFVFLPTLLWRFDNRCSRWGFHCIWITLSSLWGRFNSSRRSSFRQAMLTKISPTLLLCWPFFFWESVCSSAFELDAAESSKSGAVFFVAFLPPLPFLPLPRPLPFPLPRPLPFPLPLPLPLPFFFPVCASSSGTAFLKASWAFFLMAPAWQHHLIVIHG